MRNSKFLLLFLVSMYSTLVAQDQLGLRQDNYSGINAIGLNPAANVNSPLSWDLNLAGGGIFIENNYAYLRNTNLLGALLNGNNFNIAPQLSPEPVPTTGLAMDFYQRDRRYSGYANATVLGPGFMLNLEDQSFGVYTKVRAAAGGRRIPSELGYYSLSNIQDVDQLSLSPFQAAGMVWGEIGVNYARAIDENLSVGATVKYLQGYEGIAMRNHSTTRLQSLPGDVVSVDNFDYTFAFATDYVQTQNGSVRDFLTAQGAGLGVDIGATYTIDGGDHYQWKFGASLMDIGFVNFRNNAQFNHFEARDTFQISSAERDEMSGILETIEFLNGKVIARPHNSQQTENFNLWLPAGLTLSADYSLNKQFYVNALMIRRLPTPGIGVRRGNLLAVTPRFESRWFGVSAPLALYDDRDFRMGLAVRMGPLTIGSDNLSGFFTQTEFSGGDVYAALKINPFEMDLGGGRGGYRPKKFSRPKRRPSRGEPKCYKPRR